jgi:hypothetical protein
MKRWTVLLVLLALATAGTWALPGGARCLGNCCRYRPL